MNRTAIDLFLVVFFFKHTTCMLVNHKTSKWSLLTTHPVKAAKWISVVFRNRYKVLRLAYYEYPSTDIRLLVPLAYLSQKAINSKAFLLASVRSLHWSCWGTNLQSVALITEHTCRTRWFHLVLGKHFLVLESVMCIVFALMRYTHTDLVSTHAHNHYNYSLKNVFSPLVLNTFRH